MYFVVITGIRHRQKIHKLSFLAYVHNEGLLLRSRNRRVGLQTEAHKWLDGWMGATNSKKKGGLLLLEAFSKSAISCGIS